MPLEEQRTTLAEATATTSREESLRARKATAVEFLASLQAHKGDMGRRED